MRFVFGAMLCFGFLLGYFSLGLVVYRLACKVWKRVCLVVFYLFRFDGLCFARFCASTSGWRWFWVGFG